MSVTLPFAIIYAVGLALKGHGSTCVECQAAAAVAGARQGVRGRNIALRMVSSFGVIGGVSPDPRPVAGCPDSSGSVSVP